jgi:hypothetical protein
MTPRGLETTALTILAIADAIKLLLILLGGVNF